MSSQRQNNMRRGISGRLGHDWHGINSILVVCKAIYRRCLCEILGEVHVLNANWGDSMMARVECSVDPAKEPWLDGLCVVWLWWANNKNRREPALVQVVHYILYLINYFLVSLSSTCSSAIWCAVSLVAAEILGCLPRRRPNPAAYTYSKQVPWPGFGGKVSLSSTASNSLCTILADSPRLLHVKLVMPVRLWHTNDHHSQQQQRPHHISWRKNPGETIKK